MRVVFVGWSGRRRLLLASVNPFNPVDCGLVPSRKTTWSGSLLIKMQLLAKFWRFRAACHLRNEIPRYMTLIGQDRNHRCRVACSDEEDRFRGDVFRWPLVAPRTDQPNIVPEDHVGKARAWEAFGCSQSRQGRHWGKRSRCCAILWCKWKGAP